MRSSELLLLLSLLGGSEPPSQDSLGRRSPLKGLWRLFKFFLFLFLLLWFLFHQDFFELQVKPVWKGNQSQIESPAPVNSQRDKTG